jgi:hypothetical protein
MATGAVLRHFPATGGFRTSDLPPLNAMAKELGLARETLSRLLIVFKRQELVNNNCQSVEPFAKQSCRPNSALCSKFYPQNINYMPVVKFFACLDFERKSTFC